MIGVIKMNLAWLQTFKVIVEKGSLSGAARDIHLTQPAVSKQLSALEEYYGTLLLYRTTRSVELTAAGKIVYQQSQKALDLLARSRDEVQALTQTVNGELHLGASTIPGEYLLPRLLGGFQQRYPGVRVQLEIGDSRSIARQVSEGRQELGVIGAAIKYRNLNYELFYQDQLVVIVPRGHHLAGREKISLQEFLNEPIVAREPGSGTRIATEEKLQAAGISPAVLKIRLELGSTEAVLHAVSGGVGISLVSRLAARSLAQAGELSCLGITDFNLKRGLYFITRKTPELRVSLVTLLNFLREAVQTEKTSYCYT